MTGIFRSEALPGSSVPVSFSITVDAVSCNIAPELIAAPSAPAAAVPETEAAPETEAVVETAAPETEAPEVVAPAEPVQAPQTFDAAAIAVLAAVISGGAALVSNKIKR